MIAGCALAIEDRAWVRAVWLGAVAVLNCALLLGLIVLMSSLAGFESMRVSYDG